jgi:hypothetical protein
VKAVQRLLQHRKRMMDRGDLIGCALWILFSLWAVHSSFTLGIGALRSPGPGFFPFWAGIGLALFAGVLLLRTPANEPFPAQRADREGARPKTPLAVIATLVLYCLLLEKLGYLLATAGLMAVLFSLGRMKPRTMVMGSLTASLFSYLLFSHLLGTPLPRGILSF